MSTIPKEKLKILVTEPNIIGFTPYDIQNDFIDLFKDPNLTEDDVAKFVKLFKNNSCTSMYGGHIEELRKGNF